MQSEGFKKECHSKMCKFIGDPMHYHYVLLFCSMEVISQER